MFATPNDNFFDNSSPCPWIVLSFWDMLCCCKGGTSSWQNAGHPATAWYEKGRRPLGGPDCGGPQGKWQSHLPVCVGPHAEGIAEQTPPEHRNLSGCGVDRGQQNHPGRIVGSMAGRVQVRDYTLQHHVRLPAVCQTLHQAHPGR